MGTACALCSPAALECFNPVKDLAGEVWKTTKAWPQLTEMILWNTVSRMKNRIMQGDEWGSGPIKPFGGWTETEPSVLHLLLNHTTLSSRLAGSWYSFCWDIPGKANSVFEVSPMSLLAKHVGVGGQHGFSWQQGIDGHQLPQTKWRVLWGRWVLTALPLM